jgi:hypothetical protein
MTALAMGAATSPPVASLPRLPTDVIQVGAIR